MQRPPGPHRGIVVGEVDAEVHALLRVGPARGELARHREPPAPGPPAAAHLDPSLLGVVEREELLGQFEQSGAQLFGDSVADEAQEPHRGTRFDDLASRLAALLLGRARIEERADVDGGDRVGVGGRIGVGDRMGVHRATMPRTRRRSSGATAIPRASTGPTGRVGSTDMQFRHLGRSGLQVSAVSYGNWITHGSQVGDEVATACVHAALDLGVTTFDTADVYAGTRAETVLGDALAGQRRESIELFTKVYWPTGPGRNDVGLSRKHIMESCHGSLRRLRTDYVDLYQAHRYDTETPLEETMVAFADLVRAGKVHYIGVSEWTAEQIREGAALAAELRIPFVSNQPQYSLLWRVIEDEVIPASREVGVSQIVWSPMAQGVLTGKYRPGATPPDGSRATDDQGGADFVQRFLRDEVLEAVARLAPLADEAGMTLAQLAVAWVLRNEDVASAIVGASRPEQLTDTVAAADLQLDDDLAARVEAELEPVVTRDPTLTARMAPAKRPGS